MKKKKAFTLAEVLITLGIIGVVAAMTLPTLIAHYQKVVLETQYKKGMSVLANAMQMEMARNETPGDFISTPIMQCWNPSDYGYAKCLELKNQGLFNLIFDSSSSEFMDKIMSIEYDTQYEALLSSILNPPAYAQDIPANLNNPWGFAFYTFMTSDGAVFGYVEHQTDWNNELIGVVMLMDINGEKRPNKYGQDLHMLAVSKKGKISNIDCYLETFRASGVQACQIEDIERAFDVKVPSDLN